MHRYDELEKLYYKKIYRKIFFIVSVFLIIVILSLLIYKHNHKTNKKIIFHSKKIEINKPILKVKKKKIEKENKSKKTKPKNSTENIKTREELIFILPDINNTKENIVSKKNQKTKTIPSTHIEKENNNTKSNPNNKINIKETSIKNVNILIKKFNQNPNYDLAMMISKFFFDKNNLKKAQKWALKANEMDPERVESWIVFANILIREKKVNKAKEILKTYLNSYGQNDIIEKKLRSINE